MLSATLVLAAAVAAAPANPILFVTQVPIAGDFTTVASTFGNQTGQIDVAPRGGDLWIRYNLHVANGTAAHVTPNGKTYEVAHFQLYQAEQLRGLGGTQSPRPGRRVLARAAGSTSIAADGSVAMLVPARRAISWQTTDPSGTPVVRERYWLTFQPGEVRVCGSCHGVNTHDQLGQPPPQNSSEALRALLDLWKQEQTPRRRAVRK